MLKTLSSIPLLCLSAFPLASIALDTSDWYAFTPENDVTTASAIGLEDWNTEPAGQHGRIQLDGDRLVYNGAPIKLWGTNIGFANSAPQRREAERITAFYRKFGLNSLRHHKHLEGPGWAGMQSEESFVKFDAAKLDRFDYFNNLLKENGIYIKHSPTFHVKFAPPTWIACPSTPRSAP